MKKHLALLPLLAVALLAGACSRSSIPSAEGGPTAGGAPAPKAEFSYINTGDVRAKPQLLSGWHSIEDGAWRWTAREAQAVLLTPRESPVSFEMRLYFPDEHLTKVGGPITVAVLLDGKPFAQETYSSPGSHTLLKAVPAGVLTNPATKVDIRLDRAVPPTESDRRELGMVVQGFGFHK
jgi:hypothetical protein